MLSAKNIGVGTRSLVPGVALVASSFWVAWIELIYSGDITLAGSAPSALEIIIAYVVSTTAMAGMLIVYGTFPHFFHPYLEKPTCILAAGVGAVISTYVTLLVPGNVAATIFTGVFTSFLAARFSLLYAQVNTKGTLLACCLSQILGSLVYGYVLALPERWRWVFLCLLPLMAAVASLMTGDFFQEDVNFKVEPVNASFIRLVLGMCIFSVAINVVRGFYPATIEVNTFAEARGASSVLFFFVKIALCGFIVMLPMRTNLPKLCYYSFLVLAFATLPLPLFGLGSVITFEAFGCINALLNLAFWTLLASISYHSGRSALRLFGWGYGGMALGSVLGWIVGYAIYAGGLDGSYLATLDVLMMFVMVIVCVFVINFSVIKRLFNADDPDGDVPLVDAQGRVLDGDVSDLGVAAVPSEDAVSVERHRTQLGRWRTAAHRMAESYDLSPREAEVLMSLLKGNTKQHISEELFISYNTVRSHIRSIYAKCDAHSQQDLIDKLETYFD
jgi:DNA-binding CsgD family transcriptional regulator